MQYRSDPLLQNHSGVDNPIHDHEIRISDDLAKGALAIAAPQ